MQTNLWKITTLAFAGVLAVVVGNGYVNDASAGQPIYMRAAIKDLERAINNLQNAGGGFAGHRLKAIDLASQAIYEAREGIKHYEHR